ncbi:unnamed protein product [Urochloa decumbens]|uniref:Uncharacterized protein n=1 Tax=Urochloa decumbens TaxID=240449 RepID=A0ABC9E084_9POAL
MRPPHTMARHQSIFDWGIEVLDLLVFIAGVAAAAVAAVGVFNSGRVAIIFLGGLPTVFCLAVCFRLCSAAFLKKRVSPRAHVDGDEEGGGMLQGVGAHGPPMTVATQVAVACQSGRRLLQGRRR